MGVFFEFEADFVESLRCIPMQVRFNLDTCGVKLKLAEWNQLSLEERQALGDRPCTTPAEIEAYRQWLQAIVLHHTGKSASELPVDPDPAWLDATTIPAAVQEKAHQFGVTLTSEQWTNQTPLQRFALIKLSRSSHENSNFLPALKEFEIPIGNGE
jgi:hypothetical protein